MAPLEQAQKDNKIGQWIKVAVMIFLGGGAFFVLQADVNTTKEKVEIHESRIQVLEQQKAADVEWKNAVKSSLDRIETKLERRSK